MENINEENLDASVQDGSSNEAEEFVPLTEEELADMEVVDKDTYLKAVQTAQNQTGRAKKAEALAKELKNTAPEKVIETPKQEIKESSFSETAKFVSLLKNLDDEEIEQLTLEAQDLGVTPEKFVQSNAWKASLNEIRNKKREDNKTPGPSSRMAVYKGKSYHDVVLDPNASKDDKQAAFEAQTANKMKG